MLSHKLMLDEVVEDEYQLLAIHASIEEFKLAFLLNKYLHLKLARTRKDIDFNHPTHQALYALYTYKDSVNFRTYHLVKNKYKGVSKKITSTGSLFIEEDVTPRLTCLIPEYKDVDYFLKIEDDDINNPVKRILSSLTQIPYVVTAYQVDVDNLKSKANLIFD